MFSATNIKETIEAIVNATTTGGTEANFNMRILHASIWPLIEQDSAISSVVPKLKTLGSYHYSKLAQAILRNIFLIELVKKPAIETTKFRVRWVNELQVDPRGCSFDECLNIARDLLTCLLYTSPSPRDGLLSRMPSSA